MTTTPFECTIHREDDTITVSPEGDIDLATTSLLREVLKQVVETHEGNRIDIDMRAVTFLDSSGIGMLVAAQRAAAASGKRLMLREPGPIVRMVLQVTHLDDLLVSDLAHG